MSKNIQTLHRNANVTSRQALAEIREKFPKAELIDFNRRGRHYVAKIAMEEEIVDIDVPPAADPGPEPDSFEPQSDEPAGHVDAEMDQLAMLESKIDAIAEAVGARIGDDDDDIDVDDDTEVVLDAPDLDNVPPPVEEKDDAGVFASVKGRRHFTATRRVEDGLTDGQIVREAANRLPNHEVVRIDRTARVDDGLILVLMRHRGE